MAKKKPVQATKEPKAKPERKPTRTGVGKMFYLDEDLAGALDAFIKAQRVEPSQTAVFETALKSFLATEGFWPPPKD